VSQNFLAVDRDQVFLLPPDMREWLAPGSLAEFVIDLVDGLDLGAFYSAYRADGHGRAAHDPRVMVAVLVYAYAVGERSSRRIERLCGCDVAFRVLAAGQQPDHTTIARFRARHASALAGLFEQVLALCSKSGLVKVGTIAIDGTKIAANAGLSANRSYRSIAKELLAEADAVDAAEDALFGAARGDELPAELADRGSRRARLERARRELEAEQAERDAAYAQKVAKREAKKATTGTYPRGRPPSPPDPEQLTDSRRNITDPESRIMSSRGASVQGYNAQAVVGAGQIILAADVVAVGNDTTQLAPMLAAARRTLGRIGRRARFRNVLADGGYWNHDQITAANAKRTQVLIPTRSALNDKLRAQARQRAPVAGAQADRITLALAADRGKRLYKLRAALVEPVFADIKYQRRIDRFSRRGLDAVRDEWHLITATHNLRKLYSHQLQTA
jgi:transposase